MPWGSPQRPSKLSQACWCVFPWRCGQFDRVIFRAESQSHVPRCRLVLWLGFVRARRTYRGCIKSFDSSSRTNSDFLMCESLLSRCRLRHTVPSWVVMGTGRTCQGFKCCGASIFLRGTRNCFAMVACKVSSRNSTPRRCCPSWHQGVCRTLVENHLSNNMPRVGLSLGNVLAVEALDWSHGAESVVAASHGRSEASTVTCPARKDVVLGAALRGTSPIIRKCVVGWFARLKSRCGGVRHTQQCDYPDVVSGDALRAEPHHVEGSTQALPVALMIHDNSSDRTAFVPATHHSNFCPINFRWIGVMINKDSRGHSYFIVRERKLGARRRSDTVLVSTINDADQGSADVAFRTPLAPYEKSKSLGSGGSMVARLKLKGIDGRAPPGVEPAA
ncbi:hypothetical protein TanjilG_25020 [Lupinus angustifolius]|uniref:Uncharacterized protein n=1 Tax=Lupinus angustifolius TaxID=3871 RepID=A0A1J7GGM0_LUPAN|nr:hypothetical protein TanjilG_25020 [Lupinus angustifolius]